MKPTPPGPLDLVIAFLRDHPLVRRFRRLTRRRAAAGPKATPRDPRPEVQR